MKKMYDLFRLPNHQHIRAALCLLAGLVFGFQVNAQSVSVPDSAFQRFMWSTTGANQQTVGVGSNGTLVINPAGSGNLAADGAKSLKFDRPATFQNPSNNPVNGSLSSRVPINPKTAKVLTAGLRVIPLVAQGAALFDLAKELGFTPSMGSGDLTLTKADPTLCTVAPCYQYRMNDDSQWNRNPMAVANQIATTVSDGSSRVFTFHQWLEADFTRVQLAGRNKTGTDTTTIQGFQNFTLQRTAATVQPNVEQPATIQELEDAIAAKSGWPSTSRLPQALKDATAATGQKLDVETPVITGPATSPGTTKTVSTTNNTTTTNTTHNHNYNNSKVTTTTTTSVSVVNNQTGVGETTTTTEEPVEELSECEKNPDSIGCAELDTPDDEIPKTEKQVSFTPENLGFGGGSCPANVVMTPANMATPITVINWADNCQKITTYAKPMILAMALFAAMMIIFVGKTE